MTPDEMRGLDRAEPVHMAEIILTESFTLRLATRPLIYASERYEDYLDEVRGIRAIAERASSRGRDSGITLVFRNEPFQGWQCLVLVSDQYPFEGSICIVREAYITPSGSLSDAEEVFRGVLDAPHSINTLGFVCEAASAEFGRDRKV
jgi:hypothetical protein